MGIYKKLISRDYCVNFLCRTKKEYFSDFNTKSILSNNKFRKSAKCFSSICSEDATSTVWMDTAPVGTDKFKNYPKIKAIQSFMKPLNLPGFNIQ